MSELINNRAHRIQSMKEIIKHLYRGGFPDEVRGKLRAVVRETDASKIGYQPPTPTGPARVMPRQS